jgi:hypothetical protein
MWVGSGREGGGRGGDREISVDEKKEVGGYYTDKKKTKFSSYIRKFRKEQLQSHI